MLFLGWELRKAFGAQDQHGAADQAHGEPAQPGNIWYMTTKLYVLYVQEVVTLQKKNVNIFAPENEVSPFINYYDTLGWILFVYRAIWF